MDKQKNLFIGIIGFLLLSCAGWYFMYFNELNNSLESISDSYNQLKSEKSKYTQIKNKFPLIEKEWTELKEELTTLINKIPTDSQFDNVTKMLYSLMEKNKLAIDNFNPSLAPLDEKQIIVPETQETLTVEKYPIDVELRGSFIDFGNFLDQLSFTNYYLTISNIQISQNPYNEGEQKISFISYIYTKNSNDNMGVIQNNQGFAGSTNNTNNNVSSVDKDSVAAITDEEIVLEAIQKTGATSIVDIVKIVKYIKEKTGKDIDQSFAVSLLEKKLKSL
ncbi:MAG: type 4a pilus biogenesis protein PilO [Candidatus Neomarinimicrobiota bacterium]|nr:type 4a pilus biogenesis protein PilO [Candidatus Neomarinimicrobiota bacterium]